MKKITWITALCAAVMIVASGCGQSAENMAYGGASENLQAESDTDTPGEDAAPDESEQAKSDTDTVGEDAAPGESEQTESDADTVGEGAAPGESERAESDTDAMLENTALDESAQEKTQNDKLSGDTLECDVLSVEEQNHSVTASKIYVETNPDGSQTAVSYVGGGEDQAGHIRIYFRDNARYTLKIIKDGGADVTTKEADFSDIQKGDILSLKGKAAISEASGYEFLASEAVISRVIL